MMKPSLLMMCERNVLAFIQVATKILCRGFFRRLPTFKMERARLSIVVWECIKKNFLRSNFFKLSTHHTEMNYTTMQMKCKHCCDSQRCDEKNFIKK